MSWFGITIFDDFVPESSFDESGVPDSYEQKASDHHEEVVSGVSSYPKKPVLPDLNEVPVNDDSYGFEYTGEPSCAQQSYTDNAYTSEYNKAASVCTPSPSVKQSDDETADDTKPSYPKVSYETEQV